MRMHHVALNDFFNIPNACSDSSLQCRLRLTSASTSNGPDPSQQCCGDHARFSGSAVHDHRHDDWSASNSLGFRFESNPKGTTSAFAQLGRVRNGIFA